jgi:N-acetylglucosamine kinase-like BadF-type ATPase
MLILGMDIGGTQARCLVSDLDGRRLGVGYGGGANPVSRGIATAIEQIRTALEQALQGIDRSEVAASVIGVAGFSDTTARATFDAMWSTLGVASAPQLIGDTLVAFAAGTPQASGTVIVSGTGAAAVEVIDNEAGLVADGIGWLLGDDGSGFWVGRQAVRHALRPRGPGVEDDPLAVSVSLHLLGRAGTREEVLAAAYAGPPVALARLAPVVVEAADGGEAVARRILAAAADRLEESATSVRASSVASPIVLSGGLFAAPHLTEPLSERLRRRWPDAPICRATNGAGGAAWLAARSFGVPLRPELHALLTRDL